MLKKVLLGFLGLILVTLLAFFIEFKDVILSTETTEEIEQKIGRNEEEFQAKVDAIINEDNQNAEEAKKNDSKEPERSKEVPVEKQETIKKEEAEKENNKKRAKEEEPKRIQVIEDEVKAQPEESGQEVQPKAQEEPVQEEEVEEKRTKGQIISEYKEKLQQVQGLYNSKINSMVSKAKGEYKALSEEEKTVSNKVDIGMKYLDIALGLEDECDGVVYGLIADMEKELTRNEYSTEIISVVKEYYENEKSMRKEYYKSKLD